MPLKLLVLAAFFIEEIPIKKLINDKKIIFFNHLDDFYKKRI